MNLREQLQAIYTEQGKLTPALVVDAARSPKHPLHARFDWNDKTAAQKYRLVQAAELIRSVKITFRADAKSEPETIRVFHNVMPDADEAPERGVYRPIEEIAQDPFQRELLLRQAKRDWHTLQRRYGHLEEFLRFVHRETAA